MNEAWNCMAVLGSAFGGKIFRENKQEKQTKMIIKEVCIYQMLTPGPELYVHDPN